MGEDKKSFSLKGAKWDVCSVLADTDDWCIFDLNLKQPCTRQFPGVRTLCSDCIWNYCQQVKVHRERQSHILWGCQGIIWWWLEWITELLITAGLWFLQQAWHLEMEIWQWSDMHVCVEFVWSMMSWVNLHEYTAPESFDLVLSIQGAD